MGKRFEHTLHKRRYTNKYMKRYLTSVIIREMKMKSNERKKRPGPRLVLGSSTGREAKRDPDLKLWQPGSCLTLRERIQGHDKQQAGKLKCYYSENTHLKENAGNSENLLWAVWIMGFSFLMVGSDPRLSILPSGLSLFLMWPGGEGTIPVHLSCLLALACFSRRSLMVGPGRNSRAAGRGLSKELKILELHHGGERILL